MSPEESQDFLQDLTDKIRGHNFAMAHEYEKGDLLIIDDRASLHKAGFRLRSQPASPLYRMLVRGDRPPLSAARYGRMRTTWRVFPR